MIGSGIILIQFPVWLADGVMLAFHIMSPALAGIYGGTLWGVITALPIAVYRFSLGGLGALPGAGQLIVTGLIAGLLHTQGVRPSNMKRAWQGLLIFASANLAVLLVPVHGWRLFQQYWVLFTLTHTVGFLICIMIVRNRFRAKQTLEEARFQAVTDHLTGLPNLRWLDRAYLVRPAAEPSCFLLLDVDHFKAVNDQYGHLAGDSILQQLADLLRREVRRGDLVCRYGGEEFAILMNGCTREQALAVAERIRQTVQRHSFYWERHCIALTLSIGLTTLQSDTDLHGAVAGADLLLYEAKAGGRNRIAASAQNLQPSTGV